MLYKFKSKVTGDLIMLEPNGRQILTLIGKNDVDSLSKGILLPQDMPLAIAALERAIAQEEEVHRSPSNHISLRQRALPFIDMLKRCSQANKEIVWGV